MYFDSSAFRKTHKRMEKDNSYSEEIRTVDYSFTRHMFRRQFFPSLFSLMTLAVGDIADALVIGNRMGAAGLAAISFAMPIYMVYYVLMFSLGLGGAVRFSGQIARGKEQEAVSGFQGIICVLLIAGIGIASIGNLIAVPLLRFLGAVPDNPVLYSTTMVYIRLLLIAAPFYFFAYGIAYFMRNANLEKEAGIGASAGNICDISLNIILVLFCDLGAAGAGIATLSGVVLTSVIDLVFVHLRHGPLKLCPMKPDLTGIWQCFRSGFSGNVTHVWTMIFILIVNNVLMRLSGETGVAVFDVIQNIGYVISYLYAAVSQAAQPILSTFHNEYNYHSCRETEKIGIMTGLMIGVSSAALIALYAPQVCGFFGLLKSEEVSLGTIAIRIFCFSTVFGGMNNILCEFCMARGMEFPAFLSSTLRGAVILIPAALIFSRFGPRNFWLLYPVTEILSLTIFLLYMRFGFHAGNTIRSERIYHGLLRTGEAGIDQILKQTDSFCSRWNAGKRQWYLVRLAVEELCITILEKGFDSKDERGGLIRITIAAAEDGAFILNLRDNAGEFNPFGLKQADMMKDMPRETDPSISCLEAVMKCSRKYYYRRYEGFNSMIVII